MLVWDDQEMLITYWTFWKCSVEMFTLLYYQILLNFGVFNTKPTITIFLNLYSRYFVINLEFPSHDICSARILDCFLSSFSSLILDKYPTLASAFLILLPYDLMDLPIFLHEIFEVNERQSFIKPTHIDYCFFLLIITFDPCQRLILAFFSLLSLFLAGYRVFLVNNIGSNLQTPLQHALNSLSYAKTLRRSYFMVEGRMRRVFNAL